MDKYEVFGLVVVIVVCIVVYLLPTIIAFKREHHYKFIIFGINIIGGMTGIGYLVAFVWAVWPSKTSVIDPLISSATSTNVEDGKQIYGRWGEYKKAYEGNSTPASSHIDTSLRSQQNCPLCKELILDGAIKCKHCGCMLDRQCHSSDQPTMPCPYCKEFIIVDALKCKYCKSDLGTSA